MRAARPAKSQARFTYESEAASEDRGPEEFSPIAIEQLELTQPLLQIEPRTLNGTLSKRLLTVVRIHSRPIGLVDLELPDGGLSAEAYGSLIWHHLESAINSHLSADGLPIEASLTKSGLGQCDLPSCTSDRRSLLERAPLATVIIPTHERAERLEACLDSLLAMDYPNFEIVVVDNVPETDRTRNLIAGKYADRPEIRYVTEPRRSGSAAARNRGLRHARGDVVAFTDDDILVDGHWLAELVNGFGAGENVACVTGLVLPMELETQAQLWFEQYGGFSKGFSRRVYDRRKNRPESPLFPYNPAMFGSGNNMAFRKEALRRVGNFDPGLGNGTPTLGGVDADAFFRIVHAGYQLAYEPGAMIHHAHRRTYVALRRQVFAYGVGMTAVLTKAVATHPSLLLGLMSRIPRGLWLLFGPGSVSSSSTDTGMNLGKSSDYPAQLAWDELKGMLYGPVAYVRSVRQTRVRSRTVQC